jgi:thiamine biosynthesis lipoprotein
VTTDNDSIYIKLGNGASLDLNALAQGYAVDRVFEFIQSQGAEDIFVEITGEVRTTGKSPRGDDWIVGINKPQEGAAPDDIAARLYLIESAMATSGNYRNYYEVQGRKVWHTINPKTGYPEENTLLSATIIHHRCITADALATACMAVGVDDAIALIQRVPRAEAYLIYKDSRDSIATFVTDNFAKVVLNDETETR